jgi:putative transcriptional regulator
MAFMSKSRLTNHVKTLRFLSQEMTQSELGEKVGLTRQTIAAIEIGKYSPSLESAFRIADALGRPLEEVFQWEG